jgi:hypothetical protein
MGLILSLNSISNTNNDNLHYAFGHSFTSDDSVTFLAMAKQAAIQLELAKKNFPVNITLSMDHSDNAARLVNGAIPAFVGDDGEGTGVKESVVGGMGVAGRVDGGAEVGENGVCVTVDVWLSGRSVYDRPAFTDTFETPESFRNTERVL